MGYTRIGIKEADLNNVLIYYKQAVTAPAKLAGTILVVHETMDQVKEPRAAWVYNTGQRRVRRDEAIDRAADRDPADHE